MSLNQLIELAKDALADVVGGINSQLDMIEKEINNPLANLLKPILDGAWQGKSANEFLQEVDSRIFKEIQELIEAISPIPSTLHMAVDIIDQADEQARTLVENVGEMFDKIF